MDLTIMELKGLSAFVDLDAEYTMSELSKNAYLPLPNMTVIIKRLETKGIVLRQRSQNDRRIVRVCLTDHGRSVLYAFVEPSTAGTGKHPGQTQQKRPAGTFEFAYNGDGYFSQNFILTQNTFSGRMELPMNAFKNHGLVPDNAAVRGLRQWRPCRTGNRPAAARI